METILLVTWFVMGAQPSSYEVRFGSKQACSQARAELMTEEKRLSDTSSKTGPALRLSAVCVSSR
jgi:hypothetical protein